MMMFMVRGDGNGGGDGGGADRVEVAAAAANLQCAGCCCKTLVSSFNHHSFLRWMLSPPFFKQLTYLF